MVTTRVVGLWFSFEWRIFFTTLASYGVAGAVVFHTGVVKLVFRQFTRFLAALASQWYDAEG